jgi:hypothetical protein
MSSSDETTTRAQLTTLLSDSLTAETSLEDLVSLAEHHSTTDCSEYFNVISLTSPSAESRFLQTLVACFDENKQVANIQSIETIELDVEDPEDFQSYPRILKNALSHASLSVLGRNGAILPNLKHVNIVTSPDSLLKRGMA